jgi:HNH endonuclease
VDPIRQEPFRDVRRPSGWSWLGPEVVWVCPHRHTLRGLRRNRDRNRVVEAARACGLAALIAQQRGDAGWSYPARLPPGERHKFEPGARRHLSPDAWARLQAEAEDRCFYCGDVSQLLEQDHVVPVVRGGTSDPWNIVVACRPCNRRKHARTGWEFLERPTEEQRARLIEIDRRLKRRRLRWLERRRARREAAARRKAGVDKAEVTKLENELKRTWGVRFQVTWAYGRGELWAGVDPSVASFADYIPPRNLGHATESYRSQLARLHEQYGAHIPSHVVVPLLKTFLRGLRAEAEMRSVDLRIERGSAILIDRAVAPQRRERHSGSAHRNPSGIPIDVTGSPEERYRYRAASLHARYGSALPQDKLDELKRLLAEDRRAARETIPDPDKEFEG